MDEHAAGLLHDPTADPASLRAVGTPPPDDDDGLYHADPLLPTDYGEDGEGSLPAIAESRVEGPDATPQGALPDHPSGHVSPFSPLSTLMPGEPMPHPAPSPLYACRTDSGCSTLKPFAEYRIIQHTPNTAER